MGSLTVTNLSTLLFKKNQGVPSTLDTTAVFSEPNRPARSAVFQNQIYAEVIPSTAPSDLVNATLDDNGASIAGSLAGKTSTASPMIRKYVQIPLVVIAGTQANAYEAPLDALYGRVLQKAVPFNADVAGSYLYTLYKNDGVTVIPFGSGNWVLDNEAGVLTFYAYATLSGVSAALPPKITFYRYVGQLGAATASQTQAQITDSALTFTKPETFFGGSTTAVDDTLHAIIVDNRDLASLSNTYGMSLQFGGNFDGAWRIVVYGGSGVSNATSLQMQVRLGGVWKSKGAYSPGPSN